MNRLLLLFAFLIPVGLQGQDDVCDLYGLSNSESGSVQFSDEKARETCDKAIALECSRAAGFIVETASELRSRWSDARPSFPLFVNWSGTGEDFDLSVQRHIDWFKAENGKIWSILNKEIDTEVSKLPLLEKPQELLNNYEAIDKRVSEAFSSFSRIEELESKYLDQLYQDRVYLELLNSYLDFLTQGCKSEQIKPSKDLLEKISVDLDENIELIVRQRTIYLNALNSAKIKLQNLVVEKYKDSVSSSADITLNLLRQSIQAIELNEKIGSWWLRVSYNGLTSRLDTVYLQYSESIRVLEIKKQSAFSFLEEVDSKIAPEVPLKSLIKENLIRYVEQIETKQKQIASRGWKFYFNQQKTMTDRRSQILSSYVDECLPAINNFNSVSKNVLSETDFSLAEKAYKLTVDACKRKQ